MCLLAITIILKMGFFSSLLRLPSFSKAEKKAREEVMELLEVFDLLDKKKMF